jgi:DNA adenine methylase
MNRKRIIVPPIKIQGIKTKLVPWIKELLPNFTGNWIEPFLGSGVVSFNVKPKGALLNDTNIHIINFYKNIQEFKITGNIVRKYLELEGYHLSQADENGYAYYRFIKERFNKNKDPLDFLFLSRAGFNGMMRFNKKGDWNIPFCKKPNRFSKSYITKIVNQVIDVSEIITNEWQFFSKDFSEIIAQASSDDIIYCDPPYLGRYVDYYNGWSEDDERRLFNSLSKTKAKFILSTWHHNQYRKNLMIEKFWNNFTTITRDHFYHSGGKIENRNSIVETLVFNFITDIEKHNHGISQKPTQLSILSLLENNSHIQATPNKGL